MLLSKFALSFFGTQSETVIHCFFKKKSKVVRMIQTLPRRLHRSRLKAFNMIDKNLWLFGQEKNLSAPMTEANGREAANNVSHKPVHVRSEA